jgi:hypothetical protein
LSGKTVPRRFTAKQVEDIPLHLIPKTIADVIKKPNGSTMAPR